MFKPLDKKEPGETAQRLRTLADLLEDPSPVTRTHVRRLIVACSSSSRGSSASGHLPYMHIPTHKCIQIHIIKDKSIVKNIWKMGILCFLLLSPSIPLFISQWTLTENLPWALPWSLVSHLVQYDQYGLWCLHFYTTHQSTPDWWVQGSGVCCLTVSSGSKRSKSREVMVLFLPRARRATYPELLSSESAWQSWALWSVTICSLPPPSRGVLPVCSSVFATQRLKRA